MIYGMIFLGHRTDAPTQRRAIAAFAKKMGLKIDKYLSYDDAPDFATVRPGDSVIFYAWYCVGKTRPQLKRAIGYLLENKIHFYSTLSNFCADTSFDFEQLARAFGLYEDIRFSFISDKNLDAANRRIAMGRQSGRHIGTKNKTHVWDDFAPRILSMHRAGVSMYRIAHDLNLTAPAVKRCLVANNVI